MSATAEVHEEGRVVSGADSALIQAISKAELDQRIATARAFPRSLKRFADECVEMATLNPRVAGECIYALPRAGKTIAGPSARLAEIVASAWGNCQAGARVVEVGHDFLTAQGVFHDLERNVSITYEVRRRITDKNGRRFEADMIGVTANAACSIALRNAVFKGVPKAFWVDAYDSARKAVAGDIKTLSARRADAISAFKAMDVTESMILRVLGVKGAQDIGLDELTTLIGIFNAIKEGDTTVEDAFAPKAAATAPQDAGATRTESLLNRVKQNGNGSSAPAPTVAPTEGNAAEQQLERELQESASVAPDTQDEPAPKVEENPDDPNTWNRKRLVDAIGSYTAKTNPATKQHQKFVNDELAKLDGLTLSKLSDDQMRSLYSRLVAFADNLAEQQREAAKSRAPGGVR